MVHQFLEFSMVKSASPRQRLLGFVTGAIILGYTYNYIDQHFPPWCGPEDFGHKHVIRYPENYKHPRDILHEPVEVPKKET